MELSLDLTMDSTMVYLKIDLLEEMKAYLLA